MSAPLPAGLPTVHRLEGLPTRVRIHEVGARDGLQAEKALVPTEAKVAFIRDLVAAGLPVVEATSFVSPRWVPQLADAAEVLAGIADAPGDLDRHPVLVPNAKGLERALASGATAVAVFVSATETFAQRNLNMTRERALEVAQEVTATARGAGVSVRGYVSMCFGDPWEGPVGLDRVTEVSAGLLEAGCHEVSLGDTIGVGTAGHVQALVAAHTAAGVPVDSLALHFHDTYGQALANAHAALQVGVTTFDASAGGLGGCPYAESATGNLATEDLVWMLDGLGIEHGVDLASLVGTSVWMAGILGKEPASAVVRALR